MNNRIFELDILRGLLIALMIFLDAPPDAMYQMLQHAAWKGLTLTDMIFPAFVFTMGVSAAISETKRKPSLKKIFRRTAILFCVGFFLNVLIYLCLNLEHVRFFGILQRLALTYFFGTLLLLKLKNTTQISATAFLLLVISSLGFHIYSPELPFAEVKNISGALDYIFPGVNHIYEATHDPEGLYGTLASTSSMLFGIVAGKFLMYCERGKLILYGTKILIVGYGWSFFDIISKKLWTAPFALLNAGGDMIFIAALGILFDVFPAIKKFFHPLNSLGKNPILFFVSMQLALIFLFTVKISDVPIWILIYQKTWQGIFCTELSTMLFCLNWCLLWLIPAEILNRYKIFIRF